MSAEPVKPPSLPRGDLRRSYRDNRSVHPCGDTAKFLTPMPNQNHPLTRAYILGARATSPEAMTEALRLIRACEEAADQLTIDQCKLAAEIMIERKMA
jgi:hypothetical protein